MIVLFVKLCTFSLQFFSIILLAQIYSIKDFQSAASIMVIIPMISLLLVRGYSSQLIALAISGRKARAGLIINRFTNATLLILPLCLVVFLALDMFFNAQLSFYRSLSNSLSAYLISVASILNASLKANGHNKLALLGDGFLRNLTFTFLLSIVFTLDLKNTQVSGIILLGSSLNLFWILLIATKSLSVNLKNYSMRARLFKIEIYVRQLVNSIFPSILLNMDVIFAGLVMTPVSFAQYKILHLGFTALFSVTSGFWIYSFRTGIRSQISKVLKLEKQILPFTLTMSLCGAAVITGIVMANGREDLNLNMFAYSYSFEILAASFIFYSVIILKIWRVYYESYFHYARNLVSIFGSFKMVMFYMIVSLSWVCFSEHHFFYIATTFGFVIGSLMKYRSVQRIEMT